jgi:Ribosomal protein L9, N-terminal domain
MIDSIPVNLIFLSFTPNLGNQDSQSPLYCDLATCHCLSLLSPADTVLVPIASYTSSMSLPSVLLSSFARIGLMRMRPPPHSTAFQQQRCAHSVRIILKEDLPNGKAYKGEVLTVKAGYARNHLIPGKYALYATPENFEQLNMKDPDLETSEEKAARLAQESMSEETAQELKAADILKHYLRNKVVSLDYSCLLYKCCLVAL